ncbi:MAG TPA: SMC-Scp complex subunit ScpB [Candidatus Pacearchaeota archaeon]|nr:SMC-Scp complex subunit ScpB [Candidatus Pacearchaeota archaeon]
MELTEKTAKEIDEAREKEYLKKVEAVLFIAGRFLSMPELVSFTDLNPIILQELIEELKERYNNEESAIEIVERDKLWKMDIKKEFSDIINRVASGNSEFSRAELGTLAFVAFKQPIKQSVVIKTRSNKAYDHIKKFMDLGFIRKKKTGHTYEISLATEFYNYFKVQDSESFIKKIGENKDD